MSTSYTNTLKLGKPAAGDTGWGNTLNGELTDMIEEGVVGMATINTWGQSPDSGTTHTLSVANGTTCEARAAILRLTDTGDQLGSAQGVIVVPANTKLYCVLNETGNDVVVKTASGTGITIPTGVQNNVVCNGTNVVEQVNYQATSRAGTITSDGLTIAGTLRVGASGATVTTIADEDDMASDSAFKLITQQSAKAYVDNNGSFPYVEEVVPWSLSSTMTSGRIVTITDSTNFSTVAEFTVPGNADTQYHTIDLGAVFQTKKDIGSGLALSHVAFSLQKKTKVNTGVSLGTIVDRGQFGGSGSYFFYFTVSGDKRQQLGHAVAVGNNNLAGSSNGKHAIQSFHYNATEDKTYITWDNGQDSISGGQPFAPGATAYIGYDNWLSVGTWLDVAETYYVDAANNPGGAFTPTNSQVFNMPKYMIKNSNTAATEFRLRVKPEADTTLFYEKTYVTTQNVRRG